MKIDSINFYALIATSLLFIDRLTKYIVIYTLPHYEVNQFLCIDLVFNRGMSFGMFHSENVFVFTAVNVLIGCVLSLLAIHTRTRFMEGKLIIGEAFIFAGAISNVIDRYVYNGVVDFIALSYYGWHFAVFNVADVFIFCGVTLMLILEYRDSWLKS